MNAVTISLDLTTVFCPTCSIPHGVLAFMASTEEQRRRLYCPNGHLASGVLADTPAPVDLVASVAGLTKLVQSLENKQARAKVEAEFKAEFNPAPIVLENATSSPVPPTPTLPPTLPPVKSPAWLVEGLRVMFMSQPDNKSLPALVGRTAIVRHVYTTGRVLVDVLNAAGQTTGKFHLDDWHSISPEKDPDYTPSVTPLAVANPLQNVSITVSDKRKNQNLTQIKTDIENLLRDSGGVSVHLATIRKALGLESEKDAVRVRDLLGDMVKNKTAYRTGPGMYSYRSKPTTWSQQHSSLTQA